MATVSPASMETLGDWADYEDDYQDETEIISTEGCFACQMNGGSRRGKNRKGRSRRSSPVEEFLKAIETRNEDKSEGSLVRLELEVTPGQTRHRRKLVRVQPNRIDLSKELDYQVYGDPSGLVSVSRKSTTGVWGIYFRQRVQQPQHFRFRVEGHRRKGPLATHSQDLIILMDIHVTEERKKRHKQKPAV